MPGFPTKPVYDSPISVKDNFFLSLRQEKPLWMPNAFYDTAMICPAVPDNIARAFVFESLQIPLIPGRVGGRDMFGVDWEYVPAVGGSMVRGGNPKVPDIGEWEKYISFPNLEEIIDWKGISERNKAYANPCKPLNVTVLNGLFERLISFMDMQGAMIALVDEDQKAGVHRLFDRLCTFYDEYFRLYRKWLGVEIVTFHDDWGSQRAPFFSLGTLREMILPYLRRIVESAHRCGCFFELHSCGKNEALVPAMIEAGVDTWQPQFMNDFDRLYADCAGRLIVVIPLKNHIRDDMDKEEMYDTVSAFVDQYPLAQASTWMCPDCVAEMLYIASRKAFCGSS
ncbi:MAG: methyltransferase [Oscillospiraceae bacterium]|nr:methyltransferase [Oscillospiraceae bacterium]